MTVNGPLTILLADDVLSVQMVVSALLGKLGHTVVCVGDGASALDAARDKRFDLILMDLQMPRMDGVESARRIRQLPGYAGTPILALTGLDRDHPLGEAASSFMSGYLRKPVSFEALHGAIEAAFVRARASSAA